ncbi:MAG TPA: ThuA domain-containing protein, partial [Stellaceae bacterium]|nr:ThuA domain-containing protein [Stellaceae bacterium]
LLGLLAEREIPASLANDFTEIEKWLAVSRLLISYVAGPYPDTAQTDVIRRWLEAGGHWLALHGTSGGKAQRVEGARMRRTVKTEHHALLGSRFLTHPPIREFRVDVSPVVSPLTRGLASSFVVEDEPYFIELQDPGATQILLTAEYGPSAASATEGLYPTDTSLLPDGKTRVIAYAREVGAGAVTYIALGHCHNPAIRTARATADPADTTPLTFRAPWETAAFISFLRNAIDWGVAD